MNNKPVLFIDSGIGGFLYCGDFMEKNPHEPVCYLADRKNFPYGTRTKEELESKLISLTEKIINLIDPKIIVLACNTATVSAIDSLRRVFPSIPFVGTVPAIKPAAAFSKKRKIGVLGTSRTIEDPLNLRLAHEAQDCEIIGIAAPELVEFVEKRFDNADVNEKKAYAKKYIDLFYDKGADVLVLGCTHFLYLLDEFKNEGEPSIAIFDSLDGITRRIEYLLDKDDMLLRAENSLHPARRIILTGTEPPQPFWQKRADTFGFKLSIML